MKRIFFLTIIFMIFLTSFSFANSYPPITEDFFNDGRVYDLVFVMRKPWGEYMLYRSKDEPVVLETSKGVELRVGHTMVYSINDDFEWFHHYSEGSGSYPTQHLLFDKDNNSVNSIQYSNFNIKYRDGGVFFSVPPYLPATEVTEVVQITVLETVIAVLGVMILVFGILLSVRLLPRLMLYFLR